MKKIIILLVACSFYINCNVKKQNVKNVKDIFLLHKKYEKISMHHYQKFYSNEMKLHCKRKFCLVQFHGIRKNPVSWIHMTENERNKMLKKVLLYKDKIFAPWYSYIKNIIEKIPDSDPDKALYIRTFKKLKLLKKTEFLNHFYKLCIPYPLKEWYMICTNNNVYKKNKMEKHFIVWCQHVTGKYEEFGYTKI